MCRAIELSDYRYASDRSTVALYPVQRLYTGNSPFDSSNINIQSNKSEFYQALYKLFLTDILGHVMLEN